MKKEGAKVGYIRLKIPIAIMNRLRKEARYKGTTAHGYVRLAMIDALNQDAANRDKRKDNYEQTT